MPGLVQASLQHPDLPFMGVTAAERGEAAMFRTDYGLPFPVLAEAPESLDAWGVDFIWGNAVYYVGHTGHVEAQGVREVEGLLLLR